MAKLDNPAGRLYSLLKDFRDAAGDHPPVLEQWGEVLGTTGSNETLVALAAVAGLIPDIERELQVAGDELLLETFEAFSGAWVNWVTFPRLDGAARPSNARANLVNAQALAALGSISSYLSMANSEGVVPPTDAIDSLREQAERLRESLVGDTEIDPAVRRTLLDYVYRLSWALDHLRVGGPEAVQAASDRLAGQLRMVPETVQKSAWERVGGLVRTSWAMFRMGPQAAAALEGWGDVADQVVRALPPGEGV